MNDGIKLNGACHCGAVRFTVLIADGLRNVRRCNCSYCAMRGAVVVTAGLGDIAYESGGQWLTRYQFNTMTAEHYFCSRCGIYTHHRRRSDPSQISVNVACLEGVSPFDYPSVPVEEGISHPLDHPAVASLAGTLSYVAAENKN
ncbi:GFA family protein [Advenella sp. FME57]|uniref:GFA family protein n=1 Tax=Advenella sp. FME57 TaxID=2742604 RepID=UPI001866E022|nr:GFA family protein [Advenella sp. FME57]